MKPIMSKRQLKRFAKLLLDKNQILKDLNNQFEVDYFYTDPFKVPTHFQGIGATMATKKRKPKY